MQSANLSEEEIRRKRRRRRRPVSNSDSMPTNSLSTSGKNDTNQPKTNRVDDPFHLIAMAVEYDENKRNALEILQVPLETGKLYHNEKIFFQALAHLRKESRSFRWGWSIPFLPSQHFLNKVLNGKDTDESTDFTTTENQQDPSGEQVAERQQNSLKTAALAPIILSGLLASLENLNFSGEKGADSTQITTTTSTDLVNYTVGMRRAALARIKLKIKRERTQRIVKPVLAIVACLGLYSYAWSSLQRLLVGFYGVTNTVLVAPERSQGNPLELQADMLRLNTSPCRNRANVDHYGRLSEYAKACRITEASTFELLTSPHNSFHTKLFARTAYDGIEGNALLGDHESRTKFSDDLMQYDDEYSDDTELPFYAMHTTLGDSKSSMIPLDDVIHGRRSAKDRLQKQRWKRRRRRQQKYKQHQQQREDGHIADGIAEAYEKLSNAVQFLGDTTVNQLVREAIVETQYKASSSSGLPTRPSRNALKVLDVGSGLSGTLFSLCTPEFPFEDWAYHGIAISQPEVRRANQLVDTVIRPIIDVASGGRYEDVSGGIQISGSSHLKSFPISNITIQRASFDDPFPQKEYTTMVAIESLAFSKNATSTLMNLSKSLKPKGTLIVIEDVVAPWASSRNKDKNSDSDKDYVQQISRLSSKPSLLTHEEWLETFAAADLDLFRVRDLTLEFDALSMETASTATASAVTGLPFIGFFIGEKPWYSIGHGVLKKVIRWFGRHHKHGGVEDDDGNLSNRALYLMEDMIVNNQGNAYRRAAHRRADLGYYMYICTKR